MARAYGILTVPELYELVRDLSAQGIGIVLLSDTLEETIGLCHRVLVMRRGGHGPFRCVAGPQARPGRSRAGDGVTIRATESTPLKALAVRIGTLSMPIRQLAPPALLVLLVIIIIEVFAPGFVTRDTLVMMLADTAVLFLLATAETFVILLGGIDLSIQAIVSLASVLLAQLLSLIGPLAYPVAVLAGLASGFVHVRLRVPSFVATLATGGVVGMTFIGVDTTAENIVFGTMLIAAVTVAIDRSKIASIK